MPPGLGRSGSGSVRSAPRPGLDITVSPFLASARPGPILRGAFLRAVLPLPVEVEVESPESPGETDREAQQGEEHLRPELPIKPYPPSGEQSYSDEKLYAHLGVFQVPLKGVLLGP